MYLIHITLYFFNIERFQRKRNVKEYINYYPVINFCFVFDRWSLCAPKFEIQDADHNPVLLIEGPFCTMSMCGDVEFQVNASLFSWSIFSMQINFILLSPEILKWILWEPLNILLSPVTFCFRDRMVSFLLFIYLTHCFCCLLCNLLNFIDTCFWLSSSA